MSFCEVVSANSTVCFNQSADNKENTLNRFVQLDPKAQMNRHKLFKVLWKVLQITSLIAFTALAVIAAIWTGISAPIYLPVTSMVFITLLPVAYRVFSYFQEKSRFSESQEFTQQLIYNKTKQLPDSEEEFKKYLEKLKVDSPPADSANLLKNVAASYEVCRDLRDAAKKKIKKIEEKMVDPDKATKIQNYRFKILQMRESVQFHKIQAAYFLGILRNPYEQRELSDLCKMRLEMPPSEKVIFNRLLAEKFNDDSANEIITFNGSKEGTKISQIAKMSISEIADRLFSAEEHAE